MDDFRVVILNHRYESELAEIKSDARAADQATHAALFVLARQPERGFAVPETSYWIWPVYIEGREYIIYYTFNETHVELISIYEGQNDSFDA